MMNVLALSLVLTTLVTAGVFSPSPEKKNKGDDVIVKDGHRTVVVEYENDDRSNIRVFISPQEAQRIQKSAEVDGKTTYTSGIKEKVEDDKENLKEVASEHLPNVGKGIFTSEKDKDGHGHRASPRELVCDAYGKCKHKIASAIGRTKDTVYEKASEEEEKVYEVEEEVKEGAKEAFDKVKDTVREKSHGVSDKAHEAKEKVKDFGSEISEKAKEAVQRKAKHSQGIVDTGKTLKGQVEENASVTMEKIKEKAKEAEETFEHVPEEVKHGAHELKEEGKKDLKEILQRGREVFCDAFSYLVLPERMAAFIGVLQLLGTAAAFGMSMWVTFISSFILARALPRQQFAVVQSKIYPVYFKAMVYSIGAVLIGHLLSQKKKLSSGSQEIPQSFNLVASLIMALINLFILEPRATKIVFDRMKLEKEEGRGKESSTIADQPSARLIDTMTEAAVGGEQQRTTTTTGTRAAVRTEEERREDNTAAARAELIRLSKILKKMNVVSSFLNILTLMALTWHLVHLGQTLHSVC